jgi:RNA polymerase sigma factor (sigma-70 family)
LKEIELLRGCQKAKRKAQEELYRIYSDRMFRLCCRYIKTQADAEDVLIGSFNKIFENISSFRYEGDGCLEAWIRRIIVNESLMWLRRRHHFNMMETIDDTIPQVDLSEMSELHAEYIHKLIAQLPVGYRTVFNLSVIEGYSHQEIATMMGTDAGTSRSQLFKAKHLLKKLLIKEGFYYGT